MKEIWKDIKGYEGIYQVSNLGRVRSLNRTYILNNGNPQSAKGQIMSQYDTKDGYKGIKLRGLCVRKSFRVHRLVAQTFIPNPENLPEVNHKDENKHNNIVSNLEWCTPKYNANYGTVKERLSISHKRNPIYSKPVAQFSMDGEFVKSYPSAKEAAKQTGLHAQNIGACCRGIYSHSGGYRWQYAE